MTNMYGETQQQQQEMVFSRGGERGAECRKWGFQGDENSMRIWLVSDGLLHRAEDCSLQIIFFISYSGSPLYKKKDNV